jgi:demethylsterigmatocystin 6-O-methyltransferase
MTHQALVAQTSASPIFLGHLLRAMASFGLISELTKTSFLANRTTRTFVNPHVSGAAPHISDLHFPVTQVLPQYLKDHGYQEMNDTKDLPFQKAFNTHLTPFEYLKTDPVQMKALGHVMVLDGVQSWTSLYPVEQEVAGFKASGDAALLVDVGGGFGQHSVIFREKFPELAGRVVVQDISSTLAHLPPSRYAGIEFEEHDFFTEQPIRGAKYYYLRHIMHDWPDEDCVRILQNIIPAMGPESLILIDEVVLPGTKLPWQISGMVMSMMACFGGIERSTEDWESLLDRAGLKLAHVVRYDEVKFHSIVAAVPR